MMKRVAVGILAAAMALSMMTACGGNGGGNGGNASSGSSNTGTSQGSGEDKKDDTTKDDDKKNDAENTVADLSKVEDGKEIEYSKSLTYKMQQMASNSPKLYLKLESYETAAPNLKDFSEMARDGQKTYTKSVDGENNMTYESMTDGQNSYRLFSDKKVATTTVYEGQNTSDGSSNVNPTITTTVKKTTYTVNKIAYYAEEVTQKVSYGSESYTGTGLYCYDKTGTPVYMIENAGKQNEHVTHVLEMKQSIPSTAIMSVPSDWEIYTFYYSQDYTLSKVTNRKGEELSEDQIQKVYKDLQY